MRNLPFLETTTSAQYARGLSALNAGTARILVEQVASALQAGFGKNASLHLRERDFQTALFMVANLARGYEPRTEFEVRDAENHRADLWIPATDDKKPSFLFEIKCLTKTAGTPKAVRNALEQAQKQLACEAKGAALKPYPNIKRVASVFVGTTLGAFSQEG
ncbi:MAG TPA: hypothetical protein DD376_05465 [Sutterella sp.]|nr:hypothetical protein [Sutterella sp.]